MIKKYVLTLAVLSITTTSAAAAAANQSSRLSGYILLQVEAKGEAWYVYPTNDNRYYLGRPADAFNLMKTLALGVKHDVIANTDIFPERLSGLILLDVEQSGEVYYIYPKDNKKYYLGRPEAAFRIMREFGLGITNAELSKLPAAKTAEKKILLDVPFTPQAPFGEWQDIRQEDGCEEISSLMAVKWARGQSLTKEEALKEVINISDWLLKKYGEFRDITLRDTLDWIIKDYFGYEKATLKENITAADIINELKGGQVVIAPMNGRLLPNPYYTAPGPIHHMIVIRGYDPMKNVFITNDPGTRRGELYEYKTDIFYQAISNYPTGNLMLAPTIEKNIIVVNK